MPQYSLVYAVEKSRTPLGAPARENIEEVLKPPHLVWSGGSVWVGASPRITRYSALGNAQTNVAWVLETPDATWDGMVLRGTNPYQNIVANVRNALNFIPDKNWVDVQAIPYDPTTHGALDWWRSGQAAATHTSREFAELISLQYAENPIGPDDPNQRPLNLPEIFRRGSEVADKAAELAKTIKFVGYMILAAVGIYAVIKLAPAINTVVQKALGRKTNPLRSFTARRHTPKGLPAPGYYYGGWTP